MEGFTLGDQCMYCTTISTRSVWWQKLSPLQFWDVSFFQQTMSRNRSCEIMRFLRFDLPSTRSARLQTDKSALISDI